MNQGKFFLLSCVFYIMSAANSSYAGWLDWFQSKDQQAYQLLKEEKYQEASQTFEDPNWKAAAKYRSADYEKAAKDFATQKNYYNQGNALANLGKIDQAINAYKKTLKQNPEHNDAKHNLEILENLKKQTQPNQQQNQQGEQSEQQDQQQGEQGEQQDQQNQQGDSQNQQQKQDGQQQNQQSKQQSLEKDQSHLNEAQKDAEKEKEQQKQQQGTEQQAEKSEQKKDEKGKGEDAEQQAKKDDQEKNNNSLQNAQLNNPTEGDSTEQKTTQRELTEEELKELEKNSNFQQWLRTLPENSNSLLKRKFAYQHKKRQNSKKFSATTTDKQW